MDAIVRILEGLFILGIVGTCLTIPMAAWRYCSVLFEKNIDDNERGAESDDNAQE